MADALRAALRAPGSSEELSGLGGALAGFRAADDAAGPDGDGDFVSVGRAHRSRGHGLGHGHGRARWRRPLLITAVAAVLTIAAGTAAARQGNLPDPVQQVAHTVLGRIGVRTPGHARGHQDRPTSHPLKGGGTAASPGPHPTHGTTSTPPTPAQLLQWCQTIAANGYDLHSKAIDPVVRAALSAAAGAPGDDAVIVSFCRSELAKTITPTK